MSISILVVDDNPDVTRTYTKVLLRKIKTIDGEPINIESSDTVTLALEMLQTSIFEILVVDLKILSSTGGEWGGLELITESMNLDPLRPIIAISGYGTVELVRKTLTQGVFDFIEKSTRAADELVESVQKAIDSRYEKIMRSGNPFTPMSGLAPTTFGGRKKELEFFEQKLYRALHSNYCEHFLVLGEWGIGKSTLLKEYKKICHSRGYIASVISLEALQSGSTTMEAARAVIEGILRDLPYSVNKFEKVVGFFDSLGVTVFGTGLQLKRNTQQKEISVQAFLHDALINLWKDLENETELLVLLMDDLENYVEVPELLMTLKSTLSMDSLNDTGILVGLASTSASWLSLTSVKKHHPLSRYFFSRVELTSLSKAEVSETIRTSFLTTGISFSPDVVDRVFACTSGHPFEMQLLCYHLFNNQLSGKVELNVWEKSFENTLHDMGNVIFSQWFEQMPEKEIDVACTLADSNVPLSLLDLENNLQLLWPVIPADSVEEVVISLIQKKIVSKHSRGTYSLSDSLFRYFIRHQTQKNKTEFLS